MKVALIGCGAMSKAWLTACRSIPDIDIVGLADLNLASAAGRAEEFGLADRIVTDHIDDLLAKTRPDAVFDVVVPEARHGVVAAALAAGCHVLSEKPMAVSITEARDLVERAAAAGRIHAVVQNRRYLAPVRRIARLVAGGAIGPVTSVHADFFLAPHFGGFREAMQHVLLLDMAIHTFDAMRCMTGLDAVAVWCKEWEPQGSWYRQGSSVVAVFDLAGGAVFNYRGSWASEGNPTSWQGAWRICGTKGSLVWDGGEAIHAELAGARDGLLAQAVPVEVPPPTPEDRVGGHRGVIAEFVAAVAAGRPPETAGFENIKSLGMVFAAIESATTGAVAPVTG